jgi:hypothetical protein
LRSSRGCRGEVRRPRPEQPFFTSSSGFSRWEAPDRLIPSKKAIRSRRVLACWTPTTRRSPSVCQITFIRRAIGTVRFSVGRVKTPLTCSLLRGVGGQAART